jgi:hypothetical protein
VVKPGPSHEIHCFTYVDTGGEAGVISSGEGEDELAWHLKGLIDLDLYRFDCGYLRMNLPSAAGGRQGLSWC